MRLKTAVCSRSVANRVYLTNHRPENRKAIMHHTQGSGVRVPNSPPYRSYPNLLLCEKGSGIFLFYDDLEEQQEKEMRYDTET